MAFLTSYPSLRSRTIVNGAPEGLEVFAIADLLNLSPEKPLLHIARDEARIAEIVETLQFILPDAEILTFPSWDCLPYDRVSPQADIITQRMNTLEKLSSSSWKAKKSCIITSVASLLQRIPPRNITANLSLNFKTGDILEPTHFKQFLSTNGYVRIDTVREPGEYSIRGGIIDIYPGGEEFPLRLDLFGDVIETIKVFDPLSQRTVDSKTEFKLQSMGEIVLTPEVIEHFRVSYRRTFGAGSISDPLYNTIITGSKYNGMEHWLPLFYERLETLFDYLPHATLTFDHQAQEACIAHFEKIQEHYKARIDFASLDQKTTGTPYRPLPPEQLYLNLDNCNDHINERAVVIFSPFAGLDHSQSNSLDIKGRRTLTEKKAGLKANVFEDLKDYIQEFHKNRQRVLITSCTKGSGERLFSLMQDHGIKPIVKIDSWEEAQKFPRNTILLATLDMEHGFTCPDFAVITETDLLGERMARPSKRKRRSDLFIKEASSLAPGDLVVHIEHGIGKFISLKVIDAVNAPHDCLCIEYEGGDKLFVPVENIEVLSRYGAEDSRANLDRLGSTAWQSRKARIKNRIKLIAEGLIQLAADRQIRTAESFSKCEGPFDEFCARFPYVETEDQDRAIQETIEDLASGKPMDRLICGDVGFGKTEVAMRTAFVVASSGKQVAIVTPTTLLCRQHYKNFSSRFGEFPFRVEQLSRLVTARRSLEIKKDLADGKINIIIGTHALLSKSIDFKDLALVIIDEEQHFGVAQKERLKELRSNVHVLTLTATPIPRTLQMALSGVRDMSLIATPPVDRLAIRTFVLPFDSVVIREAILREHYRGGQIFYVCPRIEDLTKVAELLRTIAPEVSFAIAHGQMPPTQLEKVMLGFCDGNYDVLLSTNIIESGIDIPTANTLIVHRSDLFGLSQLYQLRGRVGRSKVRAYAYLTLPANQVINPNAQRRLEVMSTLDSLGAGFQLASHDMDIRGAGNLVGEEQSGHIKEVGVELYQQLLEEAITALRATVDGEQTVLTSSNGWTPQINTGMPVLIPELYVHDLCLRLNLYRRLSGLDTFSEIEAFAAELIDRFGPLPSEVENLLQTVRIKQLCRTAGIEKLDAGAKGAVITFRNHTFSNPFGLLNYMNTQAGTAKVRPDQKLSFIRPWQDLKSRIQGLHRLLEDLAALAQKT
jgi:transcription-repair coupling factor (superfamily II helicase)